MINIHVDGFKLFYRGTVGGANPQRRIAMSRQRQERRMLASKQGRTMQEKINFQMFYEEGNTFIMFVGL